MKVDIESLVEALNAQHETFQHPSSQNVSHIFRFRDALLRYELWVDQLNNSIMLAADPTEPMQACPLLEYCFRCIEVEIGMNAYSKEAGNAVRFWEHKRFQEGIRLTLTPRGDNRWYVWANGSDKAHDNKPEQ